MVWTGYMDDSHLVQGEHNEYDGDDIDDYYDPHPEPMTFQEWTDWCVEHTSCKTLSRGLTETTTQVLP